MTAQAGAIDQTCKEVLWEFEEEGRKIRYRGGGLYLYDEGYWRLISARDEETWFNPLLLEKCRDNGVDYGSKRNAVMRTLEAIASGEYPEFDSEPYLCLLDDITIDPRYEEPEVLEWSAEHNTTRKLDIAYDPEAECPEWEAMLYRMLEDRYRDEDDIEEMACFLQRWFGVNLVGPSAKKTRSMSNGLFIEGASHTGKTTFSRVFCEFYGGPDDPRVASPGMEELSQQFGKQTLINALVLASDDKMKEGVKVPTDVIKNLIGGGTLQIDRKQLAPVTFRFQGAVLFTGNNLPLIDDFSDGIYNRLHLVEMSRVFTAKDQKKQLNDMDPIEFLKKNDEFPGILNWALEGYRDAMKMRSLDPPESVLNAARMFRMRNDPIFDFWSECAVKDDRWAVSAQAAVEICREHALFHNQQTRLTRKRAAAQLPRTFVEIFTDGDVEVEGASRTPKEYLGVKLNKKALEYWDKVKDDNRNVASLRNIAKPHFKRI